jgi:hypothetical protein
LKASTRKALTGAAKVSRRELMAKATQVPGGDRTFSNFRKAGSLAVKTRQRDGALTVSPKGPWKIAEEGASPHPKNHPGTARSQGRGSWTAGKTAIFDELERTIPRDVEAAVVNAFEG